MNKTREQKRGSYENMRKKKFSKLRNLKQLANYYDQKKETKKKNITK